MKTALLPRKALDEVQPGTGLEPHVQMPNFPLNNRKPVFWICAFLILAVAIVYWPVLGHQFTDFDDSDYIYENPIVMAGLTWKGIKWAFTADYANNWHPVTWLSHMLDCQLFGTRPGLHHLMSVLIHAGNTILIFLLLRQLTRRQWASGFVAALFALHPLHVESVAWASERKDVLSAFFFLLTIWTYTRYVQQSKVQSPKSKVASYTLSLLFFALGLMSKPMLVTTPFVLLLLDFWPCGRFDLDLRDLKVKGGKLVVEKVPFFALAAVASVLTVVAQRQNGNISSAEMLPVGLRVQNALVSYSVYLLKTVWPSSLAAFYPYEHDLPLIEVAVATIVIVSVSVAALVLRHKYRFLVMGWFWYLGTLLPVIGLVQVGLQSRADRYTYIPLTGIFIVVAWGALELTSNWKHRRLMLILCAGPVIAACTVISSLQVRLWRNSKTLFEHALAVTKENALAHVNLGLALIGESKPADAADHFREALRTRPDYGAARGDLALALTLQGKLTDAVTEYRTALAQNPAAPKLHYLLGNALNHLGKSDEAMPEYEAELRINPNHELALNDLAWLLATAPDPSHRNGARATELAERACELAHFTEPQFIGTLAAAYAETSRYPDAIATAERAKDLATKQGNVELARRNEELLQYYRRGEPYYEAPKKRRP